MTKRFLFKEEIMTKQSFETEKDDEAFHFEEEMYKTAFSKVRQLQQKYKIHLR